MGPTAAIATCLTRYAGFRGRARRPEFWWFFLFAVVASWLAAIVDTTLMSGLVIGPVALSGPFSAVTNLLLLLPTLAVGSRRLHDIDRTGWWQLLVLIPCAGIILLAVMWSTAGKRSANRYGELLPDVR